MALSSASSTNPSAIAPGHPLLVKSMLKSAGQSWRERGILAVPEGGGGGTMVGHAYTFNYGRIPMHCDVTHVRITASQVCHEPSLQPPPRQAMQNTPLPCDTLCQT